jgi:hypothetical protein
VLAAMQSGPAAPRSGIIVDPSTWHNTEDAARIPMTEESVLDLLRQHFGDGIETVFVCPHVPPKKEQAARRAHASHLPVHERILALHDATLLDGGDEGFVVTARRLCWKNPRQPARSVEWCDLEPDRLYVDGNRLYVDGDAIQIGEDAVLDACANTLFVLALSATPPRPKRSGYVGARQREADRRDRGDTAAATHEVVSGLPHARREEHAEPCVLAVRDPTVRDHATMRRAPEEEGLAQDGRRPQRAASEPFASSVVIRPW